ncbi:outer membrane protein transport protein, partial [Acinetobacter baumannii]
LLVQAGGINGDAHVSFDGWGHGFGWTAGYLFELDARTRFGIAYRSQISMPVKGDYDWDFTNVGGTIPNPRDLSQTAPANAY